MSHLPAQSTEERRILDAVCKWIETARDAGYTKHYEHFPSSADFWHSALLRRLLDGKEPLPHPPPRAHSYPWYDLIETGEGTAIDVWEPGDDVEAWHAWTGTPYLMVEQSAWKIIRKFSDNEYIITYREGGEHFRITRGEVINPHNGRCRWHLHDEQLLADAAVNLAKALGEQDT